MKKILYLMMAVVALGFGFTAVSCDDDDDVAFTVSPEEGAAATYVGTYTMVEDGTTDTTYASGTVVITPESSYIANVAWQCADLDLDVASAANIAHANDGYVFSNASTSNGLGAAFSGRIDGSGNIETYFQLVVTVNRKAHTYIYVFEGTRQ
ncbi:MAG: hypothetical protein LUC88_06450 [Prevotella sp.]|nr:hypothetical protein [Prevotella sp.]